MTTFAASRGVSKPAGRDRIVVGGVDVTFWYGVATPFPSYTLMEPFAYGSTTLTFPQIHASYANLGAGDLIWCRKGARVLLQRVMPDNSVRTDYVGVVTAVNVSGRNLSLTIGGQLAGRASLINKQNPLFRKLIDVGHLAQLACQDMNIPMTPRLGPVTGITIVEQGGQTLLSWLQTVSAMSQTRAGVQRSLMPVTWGGSTWQFEPKDTTTVDLTVYTDDARAVLNVSDDASEQPNTWFGSGTAPDGERWRNGAYPGLIPGPAPDYPMAGGVDFGLGTTDADTITGDGITVLKDKLVEMGLLPYGLPFIDTYTQDIYDAVHDLKNLAGLSDNGTMTTAAWSALFDVSVTGYSLADSRILPLIQETAVRKWNLTSNGSYASRNDSYDPNVLRVDRNIDFGPGVTKQQGRDYARGQYTRTAAKNWTGTLRLNNVGGFVGDTHASDPTTLTGSQVMSFRDIRPGMNVLCPLFAGGTLFHIAGVDVDASGATLTIDTQARDLLEVSQIIARNKESHRDVRREWNMANRSRGPSNTAIEFDEFGGRLAVDTNLTGNTWNVIPIPLGQYGQVNATILKTYGSHAAFCVAAFSQTVTPKRLQRVIGNPFPVNSNGESVWQTTDLTDWWDNKVILYAAGDTNQPCGYWPRAYKTAGNVVTGAGITGEWRDYTTWSYEFALGTRAVIYLALYPDRDCILKHGRLLFNQEDASL